MQRKATKRDIDDWRKLLHRVRNDALAMSSLEDQDEHLFRMLEEFAKSLDHAGSLLTEYLKHS